MVRKSGNGSLIDAGAFARAKDLFVAPSSRLPAGALQALASEVLARLANRPLAGVGEDPARAPEISLDARMEARVEALTHSLLSMDDHAATEIVMNAHADGATVDTLYLGLLAEAARRLGRWWQDDRIASVEVVIGAGRIYAIMRGLRRLFGPGPARGDGFRAAFASVPGETHNLGVAMAADLMTLRGWEIDLRAGLDHDTLVSEIGHGRYPIIGLSASTGRMLFPLARLIVALRVTNPGSWILVSGPVADLEPDVVHLVDADAAARDFTEAERMMEAHVADLRRRAGE